MFIMFRLSRSSATASFTVHPARCALRWSAQLGTSTITGWRRVRSGRSSAVEALLLAHVQRGADVQEHARVEQQEEEERAALKVVHEGQHGARRRAATMDRARAPPAGDSRPPKARLLKHHGGRRRLGGLFHGRVTHRARFAVAAADAASDAAAAADACVHGRAAADQDGDAGAGDDLSARDEGIVSRQELEDRPEQDDAGVQGNVQHRPGEAS